jgi:hypothetical protein
MEAIQFKGAKQYLDHTWEQTWWEACLGFQAASSDAACAKPENCCKYKLVRTFSREECCPV